MIRLILERVVGGIIVVLCVAMFSHLMLRAAPGAPFDEERPVPPQVKRNLERAFHLDKSPFEQFGFYIAGRVPRPSTNWRPNLGFSIKQLRRMRIEGRRRQLDPAVARSRFGPGRGVGQQRHRPRE